MHIKWAKTKARTDCWQEEVLLTCKEMRCIITYFHWKAKPLEGRMVDQPRKSSAWCTYQCSSRPHSICGKTERHLSVSRVLVCPSMVSHGSLLWIVGGLAITIHTGYVYPLCTPLHRPSWIIGCWISSLFVQFYSCEIGSVCIYIATSGSKGDGYRIWMCEAVEWHSGPLSEGGMQCKYGYASQNSPSSTKFCKAEAVRSGVENEQPTGTVGKARSATECELPQWPQIRSNGYVVPAIQNSRWQLCCHDNDRYNLAASNPKNRWQSKNQWQWLWHDKDQARQLPGLPGHPWCSPRSY